MSRRDTNPHQDLISGHDDLPLHPTSPSYNPHRSDENAYLDLDIHPHPRSLTPSSPTYQLATRFPSGLGKRRLSRAQEMALVDRKGERRVSGGLRVEAGGLRRLDLETEEGVDQGDEGDDQSEGSGGCGREMVSTDLLDKHDELEVKRIDIEPQSLKAPETPQAKGPINVELDLKDDHSPPSSPTPTYKHDERKEVESYDIIGSREHGLRTPETPARMDSFEVDKDDDGSKQNIEDKVVIHDAQTTILPHTPDTRDLKRTDSFPTSTSTPLPLSSTQTSTAHLPDAPKKPQRSSSISSFLSSLKQSASRPFFPSWTSVGHKSGVPERLVVTRIPDDGGKVDVQKDEGKVDVKGQVEEVVLEGWTNDVKVESGKKWMRCRASDYGWGDVGQDDEVHEGEVDVREQLAEMANRTALVLEGNRDEDERGRPISSALGVSWETEHQDGLKKLDKSEKEGPGGFVEDEDGKGDLEDTVPVKLFKSLDISSSPHTGKATEQTFQLPSIAPARRILNYRHIIHLASNTMLEPRPERIIYHPTFEKVIKVSGVEFNNAVMSILMEVTQGRVGQEHYTLHDLYTWYKMTFRKKKAEEDTLQALLLALIQVSTGRVLGEREESTLQALQSNSMILCAVPLGYCLVHAGVYDLETASTLAKDLQGEIVGNQEMVLPDLEQSSDVSSDVGSERDIPLTPPATPKRKIDKGKGRALDNDEENEVHPTIGGLAPADTPPRPSSALPISDTQYSVFPRIISMVSRKLEVTTELALFHPEVERALRFAGITCEQFQEIMFKAQELDEDEMNKRWEQREFVCPDVRWQASRYFDAISVISPFGAAVYVRQLPAFQRALIYLMMMCFDWSEDQPEEFVIRLENENKLVIDHSPYKPSKPIDEAAQKRVAGNDKPLLSQETTFFESPEQWLEFTRIRQLQIGPSNKVW